MKDTRKTFIEIIANLLGIEENQISDQSDFRIDLGCDSLYFIEVIMECEKVFEIEIHDPDAEKLETVGEAIKYIEEKLKK